MKATVVLDVCLGKMAVGLYALEDGNLLVKTDKAHEHLIQHAQRWLDREGFIEHFSHPRNHPFLINKEDQGGITHDT